MADRNPHLQAAGHWRSVTGRRSLKRTALALLIVLASPRAFAAPVLGVIYPDIREPYRTIFTEILQGIRQSAPGDVKTLQLGPDASTGRVSAWVAGNQVEALIALGRNGFHLGEDMHRRVPVVFGAVLIPPDRDGGKITGISLVPAPAALFARLQELSPHTRRVFVVYDPGNNASLIALARRAAARWNLRLIAVPAEDTRTAVREYRKILNTRAHAGDAIWLPQDSVTVNDQVVLPMILETAWENELVVFSSNPSYVQRGVLFSLYPDNQKMGQELARLALARARDPGKSSLAGMRPLTALRVAVNTRTADHLQLNLSRREISRFDLVFPSR